MSLRVTVTGASGLIGGRLLTRLSQRKDDVTVLTRNPRGLSGPAGIAVRAWDPLVGPAPVEAIAGRQVIVHLAGEPIAQRWNAKVKRSIRDSRVVSTEKLVSAIAGCPVQERPAVLLSASAVGYYGAHGEEPIDEDSPPGGDFLARVCADWEAAARAAGRLGLRTVQIRTGVVLDRAGGALAQMLTPFRLGVGGPIAGGEQYISWIHLDDLVGLILSAVDGESFSGPVNATAPTPVSNREFSRVLGGVLHRPALIPIPGVALALLYGEMAQILTTGARVLPAKALVLGHRFAHPELDGALRDALAR